MVLMNYIWGGLLLVSVLCALATGRMAELSEAVLSGAGEAIELVISLLGMMCLWTGLMKIADQGGMTALLSKLFSPLMKRLFPEYKKESPAIRAICMNLTANLLGLGNAATPMGISAMKEMSKLNPYPHTASKSMVLFVVLNTASLQLVPTTTAILRAKYGSTAPFDILPAVWLTSAVALAAGLVAAKLMEGRVRRYG